MLQELAGRYPVVRDTFAEASGHLGYDLWQLVADGPAERLDETCYTQPAMLAAGVAVWRCWRERGGQIPAAMAGHSLGEFTALTCAGGLSYPDALGLVSARARLMQAAVPAGAGAMAAILGLPGDRVKEICREKAGTDEVLEPANYNAPLQTVIAGHAGAVERAMETARAAGARRAVRLPVSVPSHCPLMRTAALRFERYLEEARFSQAELPVLHNIDAAPHPDVAGLRAALAAQLHRPVRWLDTVRGLVRQGAELLLEFGPGRVLTGLGRQITEGIGLLAVNTPVSLERALRQAAE